MVEAHLGINLTDIQDEHGNQLDLDKQYAEGHFDRILMLGVGALVTFWVIFYWFCIFLEFTRRTEINS